LPTFGTVIAKRARHHAVLAWEAMDCVTHAVLRGCRHVVGMSPVELRESRRGLQF